MLDLHYHGPDAHIFYQGQPLGTIHTYSNPYHQTNIYLRLELLHYDGKIADQLFQQVQTTLGDPALQVMLSSAEQEKIHFLTAAGFVCRRKCYEVSLSQKDYRGQQVKGQLTLARKGSVAYQVAAQNLYHYYKQTHQAINPWTATLDSFLATLPDLAYLDPQDPNNAAFVEGDELAYVAGKDPATFLPFIQSFICQHLAQHRQISFEADDCDPMAMTLKSLFHIPDQETWDTYIRPAKSTSHKQ